MKITIEKLGTTSQDGVTIVYDAISGNLFEMRIPRVPEGTTFYKDSKGNWRILFSEYETEKERKRLEQAEEFYYKTRSFLSYRDYVFVQNQFPTSCATQYNKNPFFLTQITRDNCDAPVSSVFDVDKNITLSTFEERLQEMKYVIMHCLKQNETAGHTWIPYSVLDKMVRRFLKKTGHSLNTGDVASYIRYHKDIFYLDETPQTLGQAKVALLSTFKRELFIYNTVKYASSLDNPFPLYDPEPCEDMSNEQNTAVRNLPICGGNISILTGGPGVGKTTTLRLLVNKLHAVYIDADIFLLAPTGRAAKRISEVFEGQEIKVSTIHKFLGYGHTLTNRELKIIRKAKVIIVDESSMLDLEIFEQLLSLVNVENTKIILVGDVDQLPSIGAGNLLADLINLGVHTERLTENYRSQSGIVGNARKINSGDIFLEETPDFQIKNVSAFLADHFAGDCRETDIVITPYRTANKFGASKVINEIIQNRKFTTMSYNGFHVGDSVLMINTNYKQGYFNGEAGVILSYLPNGDYVVGFGDRELTIKDAKDMDLGYAATTHKTQGSEYNIAGICIPEYSDFITRRALYTAVTRAKRSLTIWSSPEVLRKIIMNNKEEYRRTFLSEFPKIN